MFPNDRLYYYYYDIFVKTHRLFYFLVTMLAVSKR